jgi:uncharacterized protein
MEIRDVLHGSILIEPDELPIIDSRPFQRLRQIKQLGFSEHAFPSATHNRYSHSLGTLQTAQLSLEELFRDAPDRPRLRSEALRRFRAVARLAALLHDIGHGPLSHTTECAMPELAKLRVPGRGGNRRATHEDYTLKLLLDSPLTPLIERAGAPHGFGPRHVAALIDIGLELGDEAAFFAETLGGERADFRPLLSQLISSEIDSDRMDYLRRDSLHAGVSYGQFDFSWLLGSFTFHVTAGKAYMALQHRGLFSFEDFLISRFHMFLMVYFHYKSVVYDAMLREYLSAPDCSYRLPEDIERYCECDDFHLVSHLTRDPSEWARRIVERRPYRVLVELHSGVPATKTAAEEQQRLVRKIEKDLAAQKVHSLFCTSTGELSKYFRKPGDPIFVRYDNHYSEPGYIPLEQCTDLFQRYSEKRSITRFYVSPESAAMLRRQGRGQPLRYED